MLRPLLPFIILLFAISTFGQQANKEQVKPCELTYDKLPALRGLKLGMTFDEALKISASNKPNRVNEYGMSYLWLREADLLPQFSKDVTDVSLSFFNDKLNSVDIYYSNDIALKTAEEAEATFADYFGLPRPFDSSDYMRAITCKDFRFYFTFIARHLKVYLLDLVAEKAIAQRKKEVDEKKKKAFKP